jgi:thiol-disulfide isomerase/thioredoxin
MVLTAVLMLTSVDVRFQAALASHLPSFLTNPTHGLDRSRAVGSRLASLRGKPKFDAAAVSANLPVLGQAPDFTSTQRWFNSTPLTMAALRGRVVLVDFWTYTCINCIATLPYVRAWDERYRGAGLAMGQVRYTHFGEGGYARTARRRSARCSPRPHTGGSAPPRAPAASC